jgi:hypothetical protein
MPQVSATNYYRRWFLQVLQQTLSFGRDQAVALIIAIAILLFQAHSGTLQTSDFRANAFATLWPYLAIVLVYLVIQIVRAPLILDRQRADQIDSLEAQTIRVLRTTIQAIKFSYQPYFRIYVTIEVRNLDAPRTTFHDFVLHLLSAPKHNFHENDRHLFAPVGFVLEPGEFVRGEIMFEPPRGQVDTAMIGKEGNGWQISFDNIRGDPYESNVFTYQGTK